jgi:phosphoglucosamine mutase
MARATVRACYERLAAQLGSAGRVVLRASGTEPLIRVMVEARRQGEAQEIAEALAASVQAAGQA